MLGVRWLLKQCSAPSHGSFLARLWCRGRQKGRPEFMSSVPVAGLGGGSAAGTAVSRSPARVARAQRGLARTGVRWQCSQSMAARPVPVTGAAQSDLAKTGLGWSLQHAVQVRASFARSRLRRMLLSAVRLGGSHHRGAEKWFSRSRVWVFPGSWRESASQVPSHARMTNSLDLEDNNSVWITPASCAVVLRLHLVTPEESYAG
mmetsp:Transcript_17539/g.38651  ORF Transcript_17539/g.38651 Transcript_17539/m.38651 type:complete len:204 (+) Transcript_17539:1477-2088(+)